MHKDLEFILDMIDSKLGNAFDINVYGEENILPGKALYCANHFHFLDPIFASYPVARATEKFTHVFAKPSLFSLPVIGNYLKRSRAIKSPRTKKEGHSKVHDALKDMTSAVYDSLKRDEPLYIAYSGTRTKHYSLDMRQEEKDGVMMGIMNILKKCDEKRDVFMVPVAVETYKKDSKLYFVYGLFALLGLVNPNEKSPIDVMYGKPIHIGQFLYDHGNNKKELFDYVVDSVYNMRVKIHDMHLRDHRRDLSRYGKSEI